MAAGVEPHVLAIDMGTGTVKAALVSRRGEVAAAAMRPIVTRRLEGGGVEQDPHDGGRRCWRAPGRRSSTPRSPPSG